MSTETKIVEHDCYIVRDFTHDTYATEGYSGEKGFGVFVSGSANAQIFHGLAALKRRCAHVIHKANYQNRSLEIIHWRTRTTTTITVEIETVSPPKQVGQFDDYE